MANAAAPNDASPEYWPIHIARSDGVAPSYAQAWSDRDGHRGLNAPHRALIPDEDQDVTQLERWEVIVAGHLQLQLAPKDDSMCP